MNNLLEEIEDDIIVCPWCKNTFDEYYLCVELFFDELKENEENILKCVFCEKEFKVIKKIIKTKKYNATPIVDKNYVEKQKEEFNSYKKKLDKWLK